MQFLNLHTHSATDDPGIFAIVNQYPDEFSAKGAYSIGIHPWRIDEERLERDLAFIASKLSDKNCLAVGECGLDKRIDTHLELQTDVFKRQLLLAGKARKPVIIHCVAAYQELIAIKNELSSSVPMIVHGFSKNEQVAKSLVDNGFYLSFGKWLLRNPGLKTAFLSVPDDRIFLETDTAEEGISEVYELAAKYRGISVEEMKEVVWRNFRELTIDN